MQKDYQIRTEDFDGSENVTCFTSLATAQSEYNDMLIDIQKNENNHVILCELIEVLRQDAVEVGNNIPF